jgi:hypothetical protein
MKNSLNALDCPILSTAALLFPNGSCTLDTIKGGGTDDDDVVSMLDDDVARDEVTVVVDNSFDVDVI